MVLLQPIIGNLILKFFFYLLPPWKFKIMDLFKPSWDYAEKVQAVLLPAEILGSLFLKANEADNLRYCAVGCRHPPSANELR